MHTPDLIQRRDTTRALLRLFVETYVLRHASEIRARDHAFQTGDKERKAEIVPPLAVEVTVGIGKSHSVSQTIVPMIYGAEMPILILTPTRALCNDYAKAIKESGIDDYTVYRPREEVKPGEPSTPFSCYQIKQIDKAGENHQRPAQSICRQCPNGHKRALESDNQKNRERAAQWFSRNNYSEREIGEIPPCRYLYEGLPDQLEAEVLIAPAAAFSEALATVKRLYVDSNGRDVERTMQRLIIIDERFPMTETVELTAPHIDGWMTAIDQAVKNFTTDADHEKRLALDQVYAAIRALGARLIQRQPIDSDTRELIQQAYQVFNDVDLIDGGTASFERVSFMPDDDDFYIPLRAFAALARSMRHVTDEVDAGSVRIAVPKPIIEWMVRRGSTVILDATLDPTLRELVKAKGGEILRAQAPQNIRVTRVTGKMFARGATRSSKYPKEAEREIRNLKAIAEQMPKPAAIITHRAYLKYTDPDKKPENKAAAFEAETGVKIGWFNKHDRGHNDWAGRHIAIVGMPIYSREGIKALWQERRVLMQMIGHDIDQLSDSSGEGAFIPTDPAAREWLFDIYAATLVQAIGRARGINHDNDDPLEIRLYGGLINPGMDVALGCSLVTISGTVAYSDTVQVPRANDPRWRIRATIDEIACGRKGTAGVSRRAVETWLMRAGHKISSTQIIYDEIRKWKAEIKS